MVGRGWERGWEGGAGNVGGRAGKEVRREGLGTWAVGRGWE